MSGKLMLMMAAALLTVVVDSLPPSAVASPSCQWQTSISSESSLVSSSADVEAEEQPSLRCQLRTLQPAEWEAQLARVWQPERAASLVIECSDVLFFESALEREIVRRLPRLRHLSVSSCKVRDIQPGSLAALTELRRLSIRTHNTDWPAMALTLSDQSLAGLRELRYLDLSDNSLISTPAGLFCSLASLSGLNLSSNRLQDVASLGFNGAAVNNSNNGNNNNNNNECLQELTELDLSWNGISELHPLSLRSLRKLQSLSLQHNGLAHLADQSLAGLESLRTLNLSSNQLSVLPPDVFSDCRELRELSLHRNQLSVLPLGSLAGLSQLQVLDLSHNNLGPVHHRDTFAGLVRLVVLNAGHNAIARIDSAIFRDLASLQVLRLDSNLIESIDADAFLPLFNLHTLDLSHNRIATVGDRLLGGLFVLSSLSIGYNRIHSVSGDAFRNCSGLRDLDLSGNSLSAVPEAVQQLTLLKSLDLSSNRISRAVNLSSPSAGHWQQLYSLNLAGNHIRSVAKEAFSGLSNLVALNLAGNQIDHLEAGSFDRTAGLQVLRLDGNALTDINGLFAGLHSLRWLNVSANRIPLFDYSFLPANVEWLDIHQNQLGELGNYFQIQLANLQAIDASFNRLTELSADSVPDSVVQLFVNDNQISAIGANTFLKKANLSRVDLNSNQLKTLDPAALWLSPVPVERDLPEFSLGDNPWECDCGLEWLPLLVQPSSTSRQQPRLVDAADVTCRLSFNQRRGGNNNRSAGANNETAVEPFVVPLVDVRPEEFLCSYQTHCFALCHCCDFDACDCEMTCPQGCNCYHDPTWSSNIVECSGSLHTDLPDGIPMDATQLYLDGNNLTELSSHAFIGRKNLRTLYLNGSRIETLRNRTFHGLGALQVLQLSDNLLEELRGSEFEPLDHLRELYLQNNRLRYIGDTAFVHLRSLQVLRLDGNRLLTLSLWRLSVHPHLNRLWLGSNPWSCDCRFLADFQQWIAPANAQGSGQQLQQQLADPEAVHCLLGDQQIIGLDEFNRSCSSDPLGSLVTRFEGGVSVVDYLPVLAVCIGLALLTLVAAVVLFVYRQSVRIWIFSRYRIRLCDSKNHLDSSSSANTTHSSDASGRKSADSSHYSSSFDAFVSYSLKDEPFVAQVMAAELEHSPEGSYRLCLQHRDFPSSNSQQQQIHHQHQHSTSSTGSAGDPLTLGLAASRRVVLVISQSFIESEWTRPEVRTALTGFLRQPRGERLLAVTLANWTDDGCDADLSLLLRSAVTIRWGERNFWPKLRYYLPDPAPAPRHYIRNLHSGNGVWYQTQQTQQLHHQQHPVSSSNGGSYGVSTGPHPGSKRTLPHPLPVDHHLLDPTAPMATLNCNGERVDKSSKSELYWDVHGGQGLPRRYTSTPHGSYSGCRGAVHHHDHPGGNDDLSSVYSRLEHSYMSIDHGHEHIYSCVQDPAELHHQQHQHHHHQQPHQENCWSYRYPPQQQQQHMTMMQQHHSVVPRPPLQQPEQPQQHSTFLV